MATIRTTYKYKCDLDKGTLETSLRNSLMQADALADAFAVTVQRNGADVDISGMTVYGYLYASATKTTVPLRGTVSGSTATVILSEDCYAVPGYASLMIQLHDGDVRHTVLKVDFVVTRTGGTLVLDGDNILPTLAELLGQISAMEQATAEARAATDVANQAVENVEAFKGEIQGDITALTQEIEESAELAKDGYAEFVFSDWSVGSIAPDTFSDLVSTIRIRTGYHKFVGINKLRIVNEEGYKSLWHAYVYDGTSYTRVDGTTSFVYGAYDIPIVRDYYYRFLVALDNDGEVEVGISQYVKFCAWVDEPVEVSGTELGFEYGNISDGVEMDSTGRVRSNFLRVNEGTLVKSTAYSILLAKYDLNKEYVGLLPANVHWKEGLSVSEDCYIRIIVGASRGTYLDGTADTLQAVKNDIKMYVREKADDNRYEYSGDKVGWKYSTLSPDTGLELASTGRILSAFIRADAYTMVKSATKNMIVYEYDINRKFVASGLESIWRETRTTTTDGYIRILLGGPGGVYLDGTEDIDAMTNAVAIKVMRNKNALFLDLMDVTEAERRLPDYWDKYLTEKSDSIYTERLNVGNHGDVFTFFTDYHMQSNACNTAAILKRIKKEHQIHKHFFGGDIADATTTENAKKLMDAFAKEFSAVELLPALGNHEVELYNDNYTDPTESEVYALVFKPLESRTHVALNKNLYYVYDNKPQKIRYVVLNTHSDVSYAFVNDTEQVNWFVDRLTELEAGWNVVVLFHRYYDGINEDTGAHNVSPDGAMIAALLGAFNTKTAYSSGNYNFDFSNAKAGVIAIVTGHTHRDYSEVTVSGFPVIATRCDAYAGAMQEIPRTFGTITEQAIDVFCVDTDARSIKTIRIGAGDDRSFTY